MDNNSVKKNILELRKSLNLTQEEMADRLGMSRNSYRNIEQGSTKLLNEHIIQIASILEKTPEELVLGYNPDKTDTALFHDIRDRYIEQAEEKNKEYEEKLNSLNLHIQAMEKQISLLEELLKTKEEVISMLKKRQK